MLERGFRPLKGLLVDIFLSTINIQKRVISKTQGGRKHTYKAYPQTPGCCPLSSELFLGTYVCLLSFLHEVQGKRTSQVEDLWLPLHFTQTTYR